MIKTIGYVIVVALVLAAFSQSSLAQSCNRHIEAQGGFSMCIPDGWVVETRQNQQYKMMFGQASDFTPNINFKEEASTLSLSDYVAAGVRQILANKEKLGADSIEPLGQSDFTADSGLRGIRTVFQTMYKGHLIRTIQYYFDDGGRKLIVTATSLDKNKEIYDRVFDRTVRSFRLE